MQLRPGRLANIVRHNLAVGAALICHKTLPYGDHPEIGETVCRGWFDAYGEQTGSLQIVARLAARDGVSPFVFVDPPDDGPAVEVTDPPDDDNTHDV